MTGVLVVLALFFLAEGVGIALITARSPRISLASWINLALACGCGGLAWQLR